MFLTQLEKGGTSIHSVTFHTNGNVNLFESHSILDLKLPMRYKQILPSLELHGTTKVLQLIVAHRDK